MKKRTFSFALASGLLLLAGCASESPDNPGKEPVVDDGDGAGYIMVNFANAGTRADEFDTEKGEGNEDVIKNAALIFYCEDGSEFTCYVDDDTDSNAYWVNTDENHYGDKCAIVKLQKLPVRVACVLNYKESEKTKYDGIGDLNSDKRFVDDYSGDGGQTFYMSSSKFYDENHVLGHEVQVTPDMLCDTKEQAAANLSHPLLLTVERYVAKVRIKNVTNNDSFKLEDGKLNPLTGTKEGQVTVGTEGTTVKFIPEYTFLTAQTGKTYTIKKLHEWNSLETDFQSWTKTNNVEERWSSVVRSTAGEPINYKTLNNLKGGAKTFATNPVYYTFDNYESQYARRTSVVVAGRYEVYDKDNKRIRTSDNDDTFYLVAGEKSFEAYATEAEAIRAMGGNPDEDTLVAEGVPAGASYSDQAKWTGWTGWMELKGKDLPIRCIKYTGGYGYYARPLNLVTFPNGKSYDMVVRNYLYDVSVKAITGMGVGIPDPDQPIIPLNRPDPNTRPYFLHMSVKVNPWRIILNDAEWK